MPSEDMSTAMMVDPYNGTNSTFSEKLASHTLVTKGSTDHGGNGMPSKTKGVNENKMFVCFVKSPYT